ncbi:YqaJ viral recombinase family protein [Corticibacter populi]|uniref:YqaJ viral recombinase family nuclease n=1 Tax=Corticibacter populi TaxID=1550736 RepID=UPI0010DBA78C|nr:YqaJ viral recombinase family protein [Corticibacter populi]RZS35854.1 putative phage-type endonuclease [Corticibacter populi]
MNGIIRDELQTIEQGHDRSKFLGGSDIAAVLGLSPWKTPVDLWRDKTTPRSEGQRKRVFARGIRWESVVAEMLVERLKADGHTVEIVGTNNRYRDQEHTFMAAEIDFEIKLDGEEEITNVELKTVHPFKMREWGDSDSDDIPVHYTAQVMHGLGVTGRRKAILAALFGADELRAYPVDRDDETVQALRQRGATFWRDHVLTGIPPEPINITDTEKLFGDDGAESMPADPMLTEWLMRMRAIRAEIKAREAEYEALEFQTRRAMGSTTHVLMPNGKTAAEWKKRSGSFLDQAALKEAHPKLVKEFTRKWDKRVFTLKSFDTEGI